jgi:hypothetical protein
MFMLLLLPLLLQHGTVDDVLAVYGHQQQMYGFASLGVQTTLIHALLKAHGRGQPGNLLAYEAWARLRASGRQLDAQALLAGERRSSAQRLVQLHACMRCLSVRMRADRATASAQNAVAPHRALLTSSKLTLLLLLLLLPLPQACTRVCVLVGWLRLRRCLSRCGSAAAL